jgi:[glutamine synthetase] adenylyltransferase / [glutamine synthetase]-adenylyl-L-tyrosine phosphorylase
MTAARDADPRWTPAQARLWSAHRERLPDPEAASALLGRWFDEVGAPEGESPFLHLAYLAGSSEALFLALMRHPAQLAHLSTQVGTSGGLGLEGMEEALARFLLLDRWADDASALAAFRALQSARILLQDVLGVLSFESLTRELTSLADVLLRKGLNLTFQPLRERLGLPMALTPDGKPAPCGMALFALGKMGGRELNYSSDVDLVAFYGGEGATDLGRPNSAFFDAWVRSAVSLVTKTTPDGPSLRVDMNLRPRGRDGELTLPSEVALAYYREWAELWERQAWIRARACAGDEELGARFLRDMEEIVYQPYSWTGIARQVRRSRAMSEGKLGRAAGEDLKDGPGGIRDAEFAVQALQLAHGPSDRWVREGHTLLALSKLAQKGLLSTARQAVLAQHYVLLRRAEHWVQVQHMRQAHKLPAEPEGWWPLARFLGHQRPEEAQDAVGRARSELRELFLRTMEELEGHDAEQDVVASMLSPEGMLAVLRAGRFQDPRRALPLLAGIYGALALHLTPQRKDNLVRIHFSLRGEFERARDPHQGLAALNRLVQALAGEPGALAELLERPRLPRLLFRLANQSESLTESLVRMPALVSLLSYDAMRDVERRLEEPPKPEAGPDALRRWQKEVLLLAQAREVVLGEPIAWSWRVHTNLADRVCRHVLEGACATVEVREGLEPGRLLSGLGLVAIGRQGFREMHPRSDLDLVFVKRDDWVLPEDPVRSARAEGQVVREMAGALAAMTRHGSLYEADLRLRPYGASGPPVQSLGAFAAYFAGPAQGWERVAFLKGRPVAGDLDLGREAFDLAWGRTFARGLSAADLAGLMDLRRRLEAAPDFEGALKFHPGGLLHQDLLAFVLQVRAGLRPGPGGFTGLLTRLQAAGALEAPSQRELYQARTFMEGFLHRSRLRFQRPPAKGWGGALLEELDGLWAPRPSGLRGTPRGDALERLWSEHRRVVVGLWDRLAVEA